MYTRNKMNPQDDMSEYEYETDNESYYYPSDDEEDISSYSLPTYTEIEILQVMNELINNVEARVVSENMEMIKQEELTLKVLKNSLPPLPRYISVGERKRMEYDEKMAFAVALGKVGQ